MIFKIDEDWEITELESTILLEIVQKDLIFRLSDKHDVKLHSFYVLKHLQCKNKIDEIYVSNVNNTKFPPVTSINTKDAEKPPKICRRLSIVSQVMICKHVSLDQSFFHLSIDDQMLPPNVTITINVNDTKLQITDNEDLVMLKVNNDRTLHVCISLLDKKLKELKERDPEIKRQHCKETLCLVENFLTWICFIISIVCLLLTLLTYCMFPVLRTKAGVNNMFLSFSLLLAQVSLMISAYT
ncbi:adhesion G protein-coupled receptor L2 [Biomphalaria glabrata]|nr:adhesion G protein-coupled receptor L2 [Biomphalaria glabrata]